MEPEESVVSVRGLRKRYGREVPVDAVNDVSIEIPAEESAAIIGPSGCGKSTLLYLLGGLERPTAGSIRVAGQQLDGMAEAGLARVRRHKVGFVFQAFELVSELTASENVELPALLAGSSPRSARRRAHRLLERVGLGERADHLPSMLSGGQCQRVAIARALANEPVVLFADEPTGNLDSAATADVLRLFAELHDDGLTVVIVTHDERVAAAADRVISMRDGRLVDDTRLAGGAARSLRSITGLEG